MRWTQHIVRLAVWCGRPSRVVPIPRRWDQPGSRARGGWRLTSPVLQGEREAAVKTIAQGVPVVSATCSDLWALFLFSPQGLRVRPAPAFPAPSCFSRTRVSQDSDASRRENAGCCLSMASPAQAGDQVIQSLSCKHCRLWNAGGSPVKPGNDTEWRFENSIRCDVSLTPTPPLISFAATLPARGRVGTA